MSFKSWFIKMRAWCAFLLTLIALLLFAGSVFAQETTGGLQGTVKDPTGAVVAKAHVVVSGTTLVGSKAEDTDAAGYYRFANLPPGTYTITVTAKGFKTVKREGIPLEVGHLPSVDIPLEVGGTETVVEVSGEAPVIDVTTTRTMTNVTEDVISDIPHGRSFQSVIQFAPSARDEPLQGNQGNGFSGTGGCSPSGCSNGQAAGGYSVGGGADSENSYLVEGQETANIIGGYSHSNVPFDFIQEVQVKSSGIEAEHGGALGGVVNVVMKKGSNNIHGSVFTQFENGGMDGSPVAYSRYNPLDSGNPALGIDPAYQNFQPVKPHTSDFFPGFTVGGPIKKDKLWFFLGFNPELNRVERFVNYGAANGGETPYSQNTNTYYTTARIDAVLSQKIRVFGSWLYQYQKQFGENLPFYDSTTGFFNASTGWCSGDTVACAPGASPVPKIAYGHELGYSAPNSTTNVGADITITPRLVSTTRFGYFFENYHDFGYPTTGTTYAWVDNGLNGLALNGSALPSSLQQPSGYFTAPQDINTTFRNANKHVQFDQDIAWFKSGWWGTHNFKFGYQLNRESTDISQRYNQPYIQMFPADLTISPAGPSANYYYAAGSTGFANCAAIVATYGANYGSPSGSNCTGTYGYANVVDYGSLGKAVSYNHGFFFQDAWTLGRGITINAGLRIEKENVPAEPELGLLNNAPGVTGGTVSEPVNPINFGWGQKIAPRIGAAWDVFKNGKMKMFGSYGQFYDIMKLNLAISSFGGQYWQQCAYALMSPNAVGLFNMAPNSLNRYCTGGSNGTASFAGGTPPTSELIFMENVNERVLETVVPNLKPYKQHESVFGADYQLAKNLAFEARWDRRRLDSLIEDAALFTPDGAEVYQILNPGFPPNRVNALCATAGTFNGVAYPACPQDPKGARSYDGVEFRLTKSTSSHWAGMFSYTYSRLRGNYTGLTSSDIADANGGRNSPNNSRAFDETYFSFNAYGQSSSGNLPTDRPNTFKGFAYYELPWMKKFTSDFGIFQYVYQGSPVSSYIDVGYSVIPGNFFAQYVEGKGKWSDITGTFGDLSASNSYARRTPWYTQTDFNFSQNYKIGEQKVISFSWIAANLLNQRAVTAYWEQIDSGYFSSFLSPGGVPFYYGGIAYSNYEHPYNWKALLNTDSIIPDSQYGKPFFFQVARNMRLQLKFTF